METTYENARTREANGDLREQAGKVGSEWTNLIADVEDLVKKVANVGDAELARVRTRVEKTLASAKSAAVQWRRPRAWLCQARVSK